MIIIESLIFCFGVYLIVMTTKMNTTHEIPARMVSDKINMERARDKEGYIKYMTPRCYLFAFALIVFSVLDIFSEVIILPSWVRLIVYVSYIAVLIYYCKITLKAQTKFLV